MYRITLTRSQKLYLIMLILWHRSNTYSREALSTRPWYLVERPHTLDLLNHHDNYVMAIQKWLDWLPWSDKARDGRRIRRQLSK